MDQNSIIDQVVNVLEGHTAKAADIVTRINSIEADISSGRFSEQHINANLRPRLHAAKMDLERAQDEANAAALAAIDAKCEALAQADELNPADITDDVRLFNCGVKLSERDIKSILRRNAGNATMEQLAIRYAEQNGVDLGRVYYIGHDADIRRVRGLADTVRLYTSNWMMKPNAADMLHRFFGV